MFPDPDIDAVGFKLERALVLKRAEFWGPLLDAARRGAAADPPPGARGGRPPAGWGRLRRLALVGALALGLAVPVAASAHPHTVGTPDHSQELANGQNHGPFADGVACGGDPAAYGLESAHHGPDAGTPGKADDGCYETTGGVPPAQDVENPASR